MKEKDLFEDAKLNALMKKSRLEMPFGDFESRLMNRLQNENSWKRSILKNIRLSWIFFTVGSLFGIFAAILLPLFEYSIFGFDLKVVQIPVLLVLAFVILLQLDAMIKLSARNRSKRTN